MNIIEIKIKIKEYRDFFGGPIVNYEDIDKCQNKEDLKELLDFHHSFIESMCTDAQSSLDNFKRSLGLNNY